MPRPFVPHTSSFQIAPGRMLAASDMSMKLLSETMSSSIPSGDANAIMKLLPAICICKACISANARPRTCECRCCSCLKSACATNLCFGGMARVQPVGDAPHPAVVDHWRQTVGGRRASALELKARLFNGPLDRDHVRVPSTIGAFPLLATHLHAIGRDDFL